MILLVWKWFVRLSWTTRHMKKMRGELEIKRWSGFLRRQSCRWCGLGIFGQCRGRKLWIKLLKVRSCSGFDGKWVRVEGIRVKLD